MSKFKTMISNRFGHLKNGERGAVLILAAALLTVFMGMAGFAIDFGWLFWNGINIQHGADAAALGGVVYEPDQRATAFSEAILAASENGYSGGVGSTVVPADIVSDPTSVANESQLRVTVTHPVDTFFMKVFGLDTVSITKTSVAEYVQPLPLGSPEPYFGNDPENGIYPGFWGNIHGYYTGRSMGDRYSSQCRHGGSGSGCTPNPDKRPTNFDGATPGTISSTTGGYLYGVEVANDAGLSVEIFDGPFTQGGGDQVLVGDNPQGGSPGPTTVFILYAPDVTPLDTTDGNTVLCTVTYAPRTALEGYGLATVSNSTTFADVDAALPGGLADMWDSMCPGSLSGHGAGIYPLRVLTLDDGERGLNRWSLRSSSAGAQPRIYGLGSMAIYSNVNAGLTEFYLAEVEELHAGKDLVISLWDPGDAAGNHSMTVLNPQGTAPACTWTSPIETTGQSVLTGSPGACTIATSNSTFQDRLIEIRIKLPATYTCSPGALGCWWKIRYNYPAQAQDTTTWEARIEGNPVKLVE